MPVKKHPLDKLRDDIFKKCYFLENRMSRIAELESRFLPTKKTIEDLCNQYNSQRLDVIIEILVEHGLAFCPQCKHVIRETDFSFYEKSGTHLVTRNQYYDYEESYHYKIYSCGRCGKGISGDGSVREGWTDQFRRNFSSKPNNELPSELLLLIDKNQLPAEPILVSAWVPIGSNKRGRFETADYFFVRGGGISFDGWTVEEDQ